tara:strand:+ start:704 stop:913 length:210 start_codon:yes stop_codon:yes gene_type:complete
MIPVVEILICMILFVIVIGAFDAILAGFGALFTLIGWAFKGFFAFIGFVLAIAATVGLVAYLTNIINVI